MLGNGTRGLLGRAFAAVVIGMAMVAGAFAQPFTAAPADEAANDPALADLRDGLLDAVRRRDIDAVVELAAADIHLGFGGDHGAETLRDWLIGLPDAPWTGDYYWQELESALALGGRFWREDGEPQPYFCAPYSHFADYPAEIEPHRVLFVIREAALLYAGPATDQPVVAHLDYAIAEYLDVVPVDDPSEPYWTELRTVDGVHRGWMISTDLRSPMHYRACFERDEATGAWAWTSFIGGD